MVKISQRKRAEEALRESEERFQNAFEYAAIGMVLVSPDSRLLKANDSLYQMLGYSQKELESMTWQDISHPDDVDTGNEQMRRMLTGEIDSCQFEKRYLHKRGHVVWALLSFSLVRDAADRPLHFISQIQDISQRKRAEEALRESEERYRSITDDVLDSSAVGICILDTAFRVVWVNRSLERYFGIRRDEVVGKDKRHLIRQRIKDTFEDPEGFAGKVLATYDDNTYIENFECHVLPTGEREERWLEHWSQPTGSGLYAGGRIEHYTDLTERKRTEEELQKAREELEGRVERQLLWRNPYGLTFRELTVLHLVGAGRSNKEIGLELGISPLTASKHVSNILTKMGAASRTEASVRAVKEGLLA